MIDQATVYISVEEGTRQLLVNGPLDLLSRLVIALRTDCDVARVPEGKQVVPGLRRKPRQAPEVHGA